jgi:hypothetical protein
MMASKQHNNGSRSAIGALLFFKLLARKQQG